MFLINTISTLVKFGVTMKNFKIKVKGIEYELRVYKELRDEWDLIVDGKLVCDSKPFIYCMGFFVSMVED